MLNCIFLACAKVRITEFINWESLKAFSDLDFDPTMPNIELV